MLERCPQCDQFHKPNESSCPHCGTESRWKKAVLGVAAAMALGTGCDIRTPVPPYGMPPRPDPVDAGAAAVKPTPAPVKSPGENVPRPLYGVAPKPVVPPPVPKK